MNDKQRIVFENREERRGENIQFHFLMMHRFGKIAVST